MGRINLGRVLMGGLVAGLILCLGEWLTNGVLLAADVRAVMESHNLASEGAGGAVALLVGQLLVGVVMTWLYAGMRPRFGPGPRTAVYAGLTVWFLAWLWPSFVNMALGMYGMRLLLLGMATALVEVMLAALAGAWVYREKTVPA